MFDPQTTACFTGHRPQKLSGFDENNPVAIRVKALLKLEVEKLIKLGYINFISGGALGVDTWAAQIVLELKTQFTQIKLIIAKPFPSQDSMWLKKSRDDFKELCQRADQIVEVSQDPYTAWKMQVRNEYMIDNSSTVIAVWDGSSGGTGNAVNYARKKNKNIIIIHPKSS